MLTKKDYKINFQQQYFIIKIYSYDIYAIYII